MYYNLTKSLVQTLITSFNEYDNRSSFTVPLNNYSLFTFIHVNQFPHAPSSLYKISDFLEIINFLTHGKQYKLPETLRTDRVLGYPVRLHCLAGPFHCVTNLQICVTTMTAA